MVETTSITGLPNATTPLSGNERVPMDQSGTTVDASAQDIANLAGAAIGSAVAAHVAAEDPHPQYQTQAEGDARYVQSGDARLTDAREWSATTISQAEAEEGTSTTRRAFSALRVFQAAAAWWQGASSAAGRALVTAANTAAQRTALGLGTAATTDASAYASAAQGAKADTAVQPAALGSYLTTAAAAAGYQPLDSDLTAIAALSTTAFGRALLELADAAAGRTALGLGTAATTAASAYATAAQGTKADTAVQPGDLGGYLTSATAASTYQPLDSDLTAIAALSTTAYGRSLLTQADAAAARTTLGAGTSNVVISTATPQAPGAAAAGSTGQAADAGHVHPLPGVVSTTTAGLAPATSFAAITYAATVNLDLSALDGQVRTITLTGDLTLTNSNGAAGRTVVIRLLPGASQRTLTFPTGWVFYSDKPATIAANKGAVLSLTYFGTADTDCVAVYKQQP